MLVSYIFKNNEKFLHFPTTFKINQTGYSNVIIATVRRTAKWRLMKLDLYIAQYAHAPIQIGYKFLVENHEKTFWLIVLSQWKFVHFYRFFHSVAKFGLVFCIEVLRHTWLATDEKLFNIRNKKSKPVRRSFI